MEFWASSEVFRPAGAASERVRRVVEDFVNRSIKNSSLATLDCKIRYVPIIMPMEIRKKYPARSKLHRRSRTYDCAPQINYSVFVDGTFQSQVHEYVHGIMESSSYLTKLGATSAQVAEFESILSRAMSCIPERVHDQSDGR